MIRKPKYGKISVVVFITILIWVWADLALDEELTVSTATMSIIRSNPKLWVSFDNAASVLIEELVLKGPLRKIAEISKKLEEGEGLNFDFEAAKEKMNEPGVYPLPLLSFLQKDKEINRLGLKIESCKPEKLSVKVVGLVSRLLDVKCVDETRNPLSQAAVEPPQVEMLVPEDWGSEKRVAEVLLTRREIEQAGFSAIEKRPYVELAAGQVREASKFVKIKMPPEPDRLSDYTIKAPTISIALSPTLQSNYSVRITNLEEVLSPIPIKATPEAKLAYESQTQPRMTLYILDDDTKKGQQEQSKKVVYNFPPEFVRKGEIELKNSQQPAEAKFILIPLPSDEVSEVPLE
jgi:hypothetical protein